MPERIYNYITEKGFSAMFNLPFSWTTLRGKNCRQPIAVMGVVDTFGQCDWSRGIVHDLKATQNQKYERFMNSKQPNRLRFCSKKTQRWTLLQGLWLGQMESKNLISHRYRDRPMQIKKIEFSIIRCSKKVTHCREEVEFR